MDGPVYIGIAGWSYPDWEGIVYTQPKMDPLTYVSGFVDCIEINSTFYRPPFERTCQAWLDKTAHRKDFFFTAKLHQSFTHEAKLDPEITRQFHKGLGPLLAADRLRSLLAQFRYDFADSPETRDHLGRIVAAFSGAFAVVMNNHYRGAELANAIELKFLVTGQRQPVPEGLLRTYPGLEQVALPVGRDSLLPP